MLLNTARLRLKPSLLPQFAKVFALLLVIRSQGADSYTNFSLSLVSFLTIVPHVLNIL